MPQVQVEPSSLWSPGQVMRAQEVPLSAYPSSQAAQSVVELVAQVWQFEAVQDAWLVQTPLTKEKPRLQRVQVPLWLHLRQLAMVVQARHW